MMAHQTRTASGPRTPILDRARPAGLTAIMMPCAFAGPVWDPLVRIFHWSLVASFFIAYVSGEEFEDLHVYAGYLVTGLVAFRIVWGLIGTRYARFSDFLYRPSKVVEYLASLLTPRPKHYYGHNPAGGWMVAALLVMLVLSTVSGLKLYGVEGGGPLAEAAPISLVQAAHASDHDDDDHDRRRGGGDAEDLWEEIHEFTSNLALLLVVVHIARVVLSSWLPRENLVRAMITGRKPVADDD